MNLASLLSRFTSQTQKTQCCSKSDQGDCFGTTFYCPKSTVIHAVSFNALSLERKPQVHA